MHFLPLHCVPVHCWQTDQGQARTQKDQVRLVQADKATDHGAHNCVSFILYIFRHWLRILCLKELVLSKSIVADQLGLSNLSRVYSHQHGHNLPSLVCLAQLCLLLESTNHIHGRLWWYDTQEPSWSTLLLFYGAIDDHYVCILH